MYNNLIINKIINKFIFTITIFFLIDIDKLFNFNFSISLFKLSLIYWLLQYNFKYLILKGKSIFWLKFKPKVNSDKLVNWSKELNKDWLNSEPKINTYKIC